LALWLFRCVISHVIHPSWFTVNGGGVPDSVAWSQVTLVNFVHCSLMAEGQAAHMLGMGGENRKEDAMHGMAGQGELVEF
jgi:hypothetical protein